MEKYHVCYGIGLMSPCTADNRLFDTYLITNGAARYSRSPRILIAATGAIRESKEISIPRECRKTSRSSIETTGIQVER